MATRVLPVLPAVPRQSFEVELDGAVYRLALVWNARDEAWTLTIADRAGEVLLAGRKVVLGFPLTARARDPRMPHGELFAIDTSGKDAEATLEDLGERVVLAYIEAAA